MNRVYRSFRTIAFVLMIMMGIIAPSYASERLLDVGIYYSRLAPDWIKLDAESPLYLELHGVQAKEILGNYAVGRDATQFVSLPLLNAAGINVKSVSASVKTGFVVVLEKLDLSVLDYKEKNETAKEAFISLEKQWEEKRKALFEKGISVVPIMDSAMPQVIGLGIAGFEEQAEAEKYLSQKQISGEVYQVNQSVYLVERESEQLVAVLSPENRIWSIASRTEEIPKSEVADGVITMLCTSSEESVRYRGGFRITRGSSGHNNLVNRVELERYLYSVLPKEMGYLWPVEALKAQAVAARNYAVSPNSKFDQYGFDLDDSTSSQVYGGYDVEHDSTTLAVDATKGLYATSDRQIVPLFYHATSGGYIESTEEVWGTVNKYLLGKVDIYSTEYKWQLNITSAQVSDFLKSEGLRVGDVHGMEIVERMPSGRVYRLRFHGSEGSVEVKAHRLTSYLGNNVMRSALYSFDPETENGIFSEDIEAIIEKIGDGKNVTVAPNPSSSSQSSQPQQLQKLSEIIGPTLSKNPPNMTEKEVKEEIAKANAAVERGTIQDLIPKKHRLSETEHALFTNGSIKLYGHGYGHGVGMSQVGAKRMALQGYTYDQILKFYYDGIEIVKDN